MVVESVGSFPVILVKIATSLLAPQIMLNFSKMDGIKTFCGLNIFRVCVGGGGASGMNPKPIKKLSLAVLRNNYLQGFFQCPKFS